MIWEISAVSEKRHWKNSALTSVSNRLRSSYLEKRDSRISFFLSDERSRGISGGYRLLFIISVRNLSQY